MDDYLKCSKCSKIDHEGNFCRCENRNIRIAKEKRQRKESSWQPDRLNPEDGYKISKAISDSQNIVHT